MSEKRLKRIQAYTRRLVTHFIHALHRALTTHAIKSPAVHSPTGTVTLTLPDLQIDFPASCDEESYTRVISTVALTPGTPTNHHACFRPIRQSGRISARNIYHR